MKREELPNETPREDLMREALKHYEELATKACWHRSDIPDAIRAYYTPLPPAEGAEEILAKGKVLMFGHVIVDPIMLPEGIYATKELRIYLPGMTIEHLIEMGKSFRDKTRTQWLPDSYFDNLSKCELIDVDVVRDATLHAQRIADKMVEERLRGELIAYGKVVRSWGIVIPSDILECSIDEYLKSRER